MLRQDVDSKQVWEYFLENESVTKNNDLKEEIIASWHFCRKKEVDPFNGIANEILDTSIFEQKLKENELLLQLAKPHIKQLTDFLKGWRYMTTITDRNGYILFEQGERTVSYEANKINLTEGAKWVESHVGTNAIGLALRLQKPISVKGYEHYSKASQSWNCTAPPIFDQNNEVIGAFNISSLYRSINYDYILACVQLATESISLSWKKQIEQDIEFMKKSKANQNEDSILCTFNGIICHLPNKLLPEYKNYINRHITNLSRETNLTKTQPHIPILKNKRIIGYQVSVKIPEKKNGIYFKGIKGTSSSFQHVLDLVDKVASRNTAVHLFGETGSGKEVIAHAIHDNSRHMKGPFLSINCGAVPESLMESELFGYEAGAFTGANHQGNKGKLELADGGTLFLDEIEEMPKSMQVQLLRVLQEKSVVRIGGKKAIPLDFRIITASNQDIRELVKQGKFREDLFYRIYVFPITIPPLRKRSEDIKYMIHDYFRKNDWFPNWQHRLEEVFEKAEWKGNVRELYNALKRCEILYENEVPSYQELEALTSVIDSHSEHQSEDETYSFTEQLELQKIKEKLTRRAGNVSAAAEELGMSRATLYRKMKKYHL